MTTGAINPILAKSTGAAVDNSSSSRTVPVPVLEDDPLTIEEIREGTANAKAAIQRGVDNAIQFRQDMEATSSKRSNLTDIVVQSTRDASEAVGQIALVEDTAKLNALNNTIKAAGQLGNVEEQAILSSRLMEDNDRLEQIKNERTAIANEEHTGIGLIDTIINRFNLKLTEDKLNAAQAEQQQTVQEIASVTGATDNFARVNAQLAQTITTASIENNQKMIAANAAKEVSKEELAGLNANAQGMLAAFNAGNKEAEQQLRLVSLAENELNRQAQAEKRAQQRTAMAMELERWKEGGELRDLQLESAKLKFAFDKATQGGKLANFKNQSIMIKNNLEKSYVLDPIQIAQAEESLAQARLTNPMVAEQMELNLTRIKKNISDEKEQTDNIVNTIVASQALLGVKPDTRAAIEWGINQPGEIGDKYRSLYIMNGASGQPISDNAFDAFDTINTASPDGAHVRTKGVKMLEDIAQAQATKYADPRLDIPRDEETQRSNFNTTANEVMLAKAANIVTGDTTNPYQAPPMKVLANMKMVKESPFYSKVLAATGKQEFDPEFLFTQAMAGVKSGAITVEEAYKGINTLGNAAALYNNKDAGGMARVGLPAQTTYLTTVERPSTLFESTLTATMHATGATVGGALYTGTKALVQGEDPDAKIVDYYNSYTEKTMLVDIMDEAQVKLAFTKKFSAYTADEGQEGVQN